jgi:hypothetical protein
MCVRVRVRVRVFLVEDTCGTRQRVVLCEHDGRLDVFLLVRCESVYRLFRHYFFFRAIGRAPMSTHVAFHCEPFIEIVFAVVRLSVSLLVFHWDS